MAEYVEGYVIPIKRGNLKAYKKMAMWGRKVWMKHGAVSYYECVIEDFSKHGLGFKKMCNLKAGETAIFAFIVYRSKAHCKQVTKKVHVEMESFKLPPQMPFDMKRLAMAGCKVLVSSKK